MTRQREWRSAPVRELEETGVMTTMLRKQNFGGGRASWLPFLPFGAPVVYATFLGRPQRFLAEVEMADGSRILAYCANPGSLYGCLRAGSPALLSHSVNPLRKRQYTWEAIRLGDLWVGTNTHRANRLVEEALRKRLMPVLGPYEMVEREQTLEKGARADFALRGAEGTCFLEVKSATVVEAGTARFPDSVTPRGVKQLAALRRRVGRGDRAALLFVSQREDPDDFRVKLEGDPAYAAAFVSAVAAGVEVYAFAFPVAPEGFGAPRAVSVTL